MSKFDQAEQLFTKKEHICAIKSFLDYGEETYNKCHKGYYSGSGWAATVLRDLLNHLEGNDQ